MIQSLPQKRCSRVARTNSISTVELGVTKLLVFVPRIYLRKKTNRKKNSTSLFRIDSANNYSTMTSSRSTYSFRSSSTPKRRIFVQLRNFHSLSTLTIIYPFNYLSPFIYYSLSPITHRIRFIRFSRIIATLSCSRSRLQYLQ